MEAFLKSQQYKILYSNLSVFDKYTLSGARVYAGTVIEKLETLLLKARLAKDKGKYYHFFVYYSGHGKMLETTRDTCGVDSYGDLIQFEEYSKKFSLWPNTLSIFFLDCDRVSLESQGEAA
jgi:hypothetical protein